MKYLKRVKKYMKIDKDNRALCIVSFLFHICTFRRTEKKEGGLGTRGRVPLAWLVADLQVRASSNTSGTAGILGLYDYLDAASQWGNRSSFWQDAGLPTSIQTLGFLNCSVIIVMLVVLV